jgi:NADP-dependent 3-hydroxy acid dehydrogenase YdfG
LFALVLKSIHTKTAEQIKGNVFAAEIDVTDDFSVEKFMDQILSRYGRIDILVNNASYPFNSHKEN